MSAADELADPPGLDAAIEAGGIAGAAAYVESVDATLGNPRGTRALNIGSLEDVPAFRAALHAAVRAAAPALRAGALREAADDGPFAGGAVWSKWLRERADQIGGAT